MVLVWRHVFGACEACLDPRRVPLASCAGKLQRCSDGHVEFMTVQETIKQRKWGDRVYSVTGDNRVDTAANPAN